MDSLTDKLGLYDVVGVFFPGVIAVASIEMLSELNLFIYIMSYKNSFIIISLLLVLAYVTGLVLQELSSLIDRKILNIRDAPKQEYLLEKNKVVKNAEEFAIYSNMLEKHLLKLSRPYDSNKKMQSQWFYYHCLSNLEIKNVDGKVKRISSIYGMSRSLSFFYLLFLIYMLVTKQEYWYICLLLDILFWIRTYRFARYRVRVVLRLYHAVIEK